jgi:predicted ester cyclase
MSTTQNSEIAKRFLFEHNQADYMASLDELTTADCRFHEYLPGLPEPMDRTIYNQFIAGFRSAIPDIHNSLEELINAGDKVVVRWGGYGNHTGADLMGIPAQGVKVKAHGVYVLHFRDGKIAEMWNHWDNLNVLQQLNGNGQG